MDRDKEIPEEEKPLDVPEYVMEAFDAILDADGPASMEERFDSLMQGIIAFRYHLLSRHLKKKKKAISEEEVFLFDCQQQLKEIEKVFAMARKHGRISNIPNENWDDQLLNKARIINMKGTMGDIVTNVPTNKKEAPGA